MPACISVRNRCKQILVALLLGVAATTSASAQTFTWVHEFKTNSPSGVLIEGFDGKLYGAGYPGYVYRLGVYGAFSVVNSQCSLVAPLYLCPPNLSSLVQGPYGVFAAVDPHGGPTADGEAFRMTSDGAIMPIFDFCSSITECPGGDAATLAFEDDQGSLYGFNGAGGAHGGGTIFKLSINGQIKVLYRFGSLPHCADGAEPTSLLRGPDGNLYGTTIGGGANHDAGTVFKLTPEGVLTTLYSFCSLTNCADGAGPSHLVQGADGNLYGATRNQVSAAVGGAIFRVVPGGATTIIHTFCCEDGRDIQALAAGSDGNIYGAACFGGVNNVGTLFSLTPDGVETTLYDFVPSAGRCPLSLIQATNGKFYGIVSASGPPGPIAIVFALDVGLGPFVKTVLSSGAVGDRIVFVGRNLIGATAVSFNGTPATFKVVSATSIVTTVPAGASSGPVTVAIPAVTLTSNIPFSVLP